MTTFQFYLVHDSDPEPYHWYADTIEQARQEICEDYEIEDSDIEAIAPVRETA